MMVCVRVRSSKHVEACARCVSSQICKKYPNYFLRGSNFFMVPADL